MPAAAEVVALDTSAAIPLLVATHAAHTNVAAWLGSRRATLAGHALPETYSVLTRLPGDLRLRPADAVRLLEARFAPPLVLSADRSAQIAATLAAAEIAGGAVYDALVGLAAREHGVLLATRDARAQGTYAAVGAAVAVVV